MSRKHGARKKRRKKIQKTAINPSPATLLLDVARALTACERAGMPIRFRAGAAWSVYGVVLPPYHGGMWEVRSFKPHPYAVPGVSSPPDDLDD